MTILLLLDSSSSRCGQRDCSGRGSQQTEDKRNEIQQQGRTYQEHQSHSLAADNEGRAGGACLSDDGSSTGKGSLSTGTPAAARTEEGGCSSSRSSYPPIVWYDEGRGKLMIDRQQLLRERGESTRGDWTLRFLGTGSMQSSVRT
ncbi:unnamed protein product [Rangifer tarandus platyrhynchus]|uniref:Uncharacterized protein n=1 Tax=Rangifer tarandus platyrhynchus TaxID=3082113 RepID=A0ABN8XM88_RANTA|nr:unnamed protein product [Rangifer tarandus platyrhynchus]